MRRRGHGEQRLGDAGVALLSALLAVALLTLIVVEMTDATLVGSHLNRNAGNSISAQLLARSAEAVAEGLLVELKRREPNKTALRQGIGVPIPDIPVGDGSAGVVIEDEQGKLDLNKVGQQREALALLFEELGIDDGLLDSIAVWIAEAPGGGPSPDAAGECALAIPCAPPGRPLRSLDELAVIKGFDSATIERLRPYATAFTGAEGRKGVNINTARAAVLRALGCSVGSDFSAPMEGFESTDDLTECDGVDRAMLHLDSKVFSIQARGTMGDTTETLFAVVDRSSSRPKRLYWRERPVFAVAPIGVP